MKTLFLILAMLVLSVSCGKGGGGLSSTTTESSSKYTPGGDIKVTYDDVIDDLANKRTMEEKEVLSQLTRLWDTEEIVMKELDKVLSISCTDGICEITRK